MCWLATTNADKNTDLTKLVDDEFLQHILPHEKPVIDLELLFLEGIKADIPADKQSVFKQILQHYRQLDYTNQRLAEKEWHCAAVLLEHHGDNDQLEPLLNHWREQWQQFKQRVDGNIPQWMIDYATKMDVKWP
ncbi:MAG: hypothetical protein MJK04_04395 [Psychrosphaera sp.]|nr:hypothetical protein [Psychrosphaera sp.]